MKASKILSYFILMHSTEVIAATNTWKLEDGMYGKILHFATTNRAENQICSTVGKSIDRMQRNYLRVKNSAANMRTGQISLTLE